VVTSYNKLKRGKFANPFRDLQVDWGEDKERGTLVAVFEADLVHTHWNVAHYDLVSLHTLRWINLGQTLKTLRCFWCSGSSGLR